MTIIYSARCVRCGYMASRVGRSIADGTTVPHSAAYYDHNGLTASEGVCDGVFVSLMGRSADEIRAVTGRLREMRK